MFLTEKKRSCTSVSIIVLSHEKREGHILTLELLDGNQILSTDKYLGNDMLLIRMRTKCYK